MKQKDSKKKATVVVLIYIYICTFPHKQFIKTFHDFSIYM